jgi:protein-disulfide isomerase
LFLFFKILIIFSFIFMGLINHNLFKGLFHIFKMEENNNEAVEHSFKVKKGNSLRGKPWVVSTFVLGILVILLLAGSFSGITGNAISGNKAGDNLVNFAVAQGVDATLVNVTSIGNFYKVYISIGNQTAPYYVSKDGKYFTNSLISLVTTKTPASTSNANTQTTEVPKSTKPTVDLFVMSYCPYGTQAEKGILPAVKLLGDKIDFNVRFVYYSMHEFSGGQPYEPEMEENLRQYCIQKEQTTKFNDYLTCFLDAGNSSACLTTAKIDKTKLNTCTAAADKEFGVTASENDKSTWLSGTYPLFNVDKALNDQYNIGGSPTLVINGVQVNSARDPASYLDAICKAFSDGSVPAECGNQLSTTAYGPGFGYSGSGSTTAAQCG